MVFAFALDNRCIPLALQLEHAVRRNFSGLEELNTWEIFKKHLDSYAKVYRLIEYYKY